MKFTALKFQLSQASDWWPKHQSILIDGRIVITYIKYIDLMYIKLLMLMEVLTLYICQMLLFSQPLYLGDTRFEGYALCVIQTVLVKQ
jgi:hypothetical protein